MSPWLIVPVKSLTSGKSRLAQTLSAAERRSLNERLLRHVLGVATRFPGRDHTLVVSACEHALDLAREHGVLTLKEEGPPELNAALRQATHYACKRGASELVVVHADLPLLSVEDVQRLVEAGRAAKGLAIAANRTLTGTNALYFPASVQFAFRFGPDSCRLHMEEAQNQRLASTVISLAGLAFDIDTAQDFEEFTARSAGATAADDCKTAPLSAA